MLHKITSSAVSATSCTHYISFISLQFGYKLWTTDGPVLLGDWSLKVRILMSSAMMSRPFNSAYMNTILTIYLDTTPAYVKASVIGVVDSLATNLAFRVKSIWTSKMRLLSM